MLPPSCSEVARDWMQHTVNARRLITGVYRRCGLLWADLSPWHWAYSVSHSYCSYCSHPGTEQLCRESVILLWFCSCQLSYCSLNFLSFWSLKECYVFLFVLLCNYLLLLVLVYSVIYYGFYYSYHYFNIVHSPLGTLTLMFFNSLLIAGQLVPPRLLVQSFSFVNIWKY